jgi:hypothetical protein
VEAKRYEKDCSFGLEMGKIVAVFQML